MYEQLKTLVDVIYYSALTYNDKTFLQYKENNNFKSISYKEFIELFESFAASLYNIGVRKNDKIAIISDNMYKWLISDFAILSLGATDVPRGSDTMAQELSYILKHSDSRYCIVEDDEQANKVLSILNNDYPIKDIILLTGDLSKVKNSNSSIKLRHFDSMLEEGKELKTKFVKELKELRNSVNELDIATIIYTSGTTGLPKGVMLLHKNIMHNLHNLPEIIDVSEKERWISILPVWHVFERTVEYCIALTGGSMAYSKPTAKHLLPDLAEIKPTFMVSVPRIWEALYTGIETKVKSGSMISKIIFNTFIKEGIHFSKMKRILFNRNPLFKKEFILLTLIKKLWAILNIIIFFIPDLIGDLLVFKKIRQKTGGCLRRPISGGGALPEYVDNFFSAIKINILEGYGLTETSPVVSLRDYKRPVFKTVGKPIPNTEVMIGDDNWNKLDNQHKQGIVYIKGDLVMAGYYKDKEKTDKVIKNGWFNSGDLGRLTITGEIQLVGRAKDTIVLYGGENIEPQPIEDKLLEDPLIHQVIVVGQDKKTLGALIVPAKDNLIEFAKHLNIKYNSYEELCSNEKIISEYSKIIKHKISAHNGFRSFEKITCFTLLPNPFEVGKELTNSLKMKRNVIFDLYKDVIEDMYKKI